MRLVVPPVINAAGLVPFLRVLGSVPDLEPEIVVDLGTVRRVSPAGLVAFAAAITHWQTPRAHRVRFENVESCPILGYLQRMDLLRTCGISATETFTRHPAHGRFVPVQRIEDVDSTSRDVAACLAPGGEDYEHPLSPIYDLTAYVLGELGANARQHSRGRGYVAAQGTRQDGMVRLAVADNGRGIRQSFIDAGFGWAPAMSDGAALRRAIEPRMSSQGEPVNQGVGLTLVTELAKLTGAWLLLASGTGLLQIDPGSVIKETALPGGCRVQGTLVALTFRRDKLQDFHVLLTAAKQQAGLMAKRPIKGTFS